MGVSVFNLAIKNVLKNFNNFDLESIIQEAFLVRCKVFVPKFTIIVALFHCKLISAYVNWVDCFGRTAGT